jgi:hypothetical protein
MAVAVMESEVEEVGMKVSLIHSKESKLNFHHFEISIDSYFVVDINFFSPESLSLFITTTKVNF